MKALKSLAFASIFALSACSGGIGSKDDAAKALNRLMMASSSASTMSQASTPGLTSKLAVGSTVTVSGKSGTATVKMTAQGGATGATATLDIAFSGFSADGKNTFEGTETYSSVTALSGGSLSVSNKMVANVKMSGEYNAQIVSDVTVALSMTEMSATGGKISMVINGTITADGKTYTFDNETFLVER